MSESAFTHFEPGPELSQRQVEQNTYDLIAHKVTRMAGDMDKIVASVTKLEATFTTHVASVLVDREKIIADILEKSFPGGDPDGHRRYHEASIKKAEASAKMWADIQVSTAKWGIVGVLGWAVYVLWQAFLHGPSK
jgi:hypothetical protein